MLVARLFIRNMETLAKTEHPIENVLSKRAIKRLKKKNELRTIKEAKKARLAENNSDDVLVNESHNITQEMLNETSYYFENGLRKVRPYYFQYSTYAKGRWVSRTLLDIFTKEFQFESEAAFRDAIKTGKLTVNGAITVPEYVVKEKDYVQNRIHRHELPVTAEPIEVLCDNNEVLVVNKPSSMPIHPCGRYRHNSLLYILAHEMKYTNLLGIYRLDRLTSGVTIFAKTQPKCRQLMAAIRDRHVEKTYLCRVAGEFPSGVIECNEPIDVLCKRTAMYKIGPNGKSARTVFERKSFNGTSSVVVCKPVTGRTHQIRIHLQYLGFPIINDPIYNNPLTWGPHNGKGADYGKSDEQLLKDLLAHHHPDNFLEDSAPADDGDGVVHLSPAGVTDTATPDAPVTVVDTLSTSVSGTDTPVALVNIPGAPGEPVTDTPGSPVTVTPSGTPVSDVVDPTCSGCHKKYRDPSPQELVMYLHAYTYKGPGWAYQTPLPAWADDNWSTD